MVPESSNAPSSHRRAYPDSTFWPFFKVRAFRCDGAGTSCAKGTWEARELYLNYRSSFPSCPDPATTPFSQRQLYSTLGPSIALRVRVQAEYLLQSSDSTQRISNRDCLLSPYAYSRSSCLLFNTVASSAFDLTFVIVSQLVHSPPSCKLRSICLNTNEALGTLFQPRRSDLWIRIFCRS